MEATTNDTRKLSTPSAPANRSLAPPFVRVVGQAITEKWAPDVHRIAAYLVEKQGKAADEAISLALGPSYKKNIRTKTPANEVERLEGLRQKYQDISDKSVEAGGRPLFQ